MTWEAYVHLAFDEIRLAGGRSPQVTRQLVAALEDLLEVAPGERRPVLADQLRLLTEAVRGTDRNAEDRDMALEPDGQGIGVALHDPIPSHPATTGHRSDRAGSHPP